MRAAVIESIDWFSIVPSVFVSWSIVDRWFDEFLLMHMTTHYSSLFIDANERRHRPRYVNRVQSFCGEINRFDHGRAYTFFVRSFVCVCERIAERSRTRCHAPAPLTASVAEAVADWSEEKCTQEFRFCDSFSFHFFCCCLDSFVRSFIFCCSLSEIDLFLSIVHFLTSFFLSFFLFLPSLSCSLAFSACVVHRCSRVSLPRDVFSTTHAFGMFKRARSRPTNSESETQNHFENEIAHRFVCAFFSDEFFLCRWFYRCALCLHSLFDRILFHTKHFKQPTNDVRTERKEESDVAIDRRNKKKKWAKRNK